jgi:hypothetical protein
VVLKKVVILATDNLANMWWNGNKFIASCSKHETIHIYFLLLLWQIPLAGFPTRPMSKTFLKLGQSGEDVNNVLLLLGVVAAYWTIWLTINNYVFINCQPKTFLYCSGRHIALILGSVKAR